MSAIWAVVPVPDSTVATIISVRSEADDALIARCGISSLEVLSSTLRSGARTSSTR